MYYRHKTNVVGTWEQFVAAEVPHTMSLTISICTIIFNTLHAFQHKACDRRGLHEARAKSRKNRLVSRVSNPFSNLKAEVNSATKLWKDLGASTNPGVVGKQNCMQATFDANVENPVES